MHRPLAWWLLAVAVLQAQPALRFDPRTQILEATGLDASLTAGLSESSLSQAFRVFLGDAQTPILGDYEVNGTSLRFTPRFPFLPGRQHRAVLDLGPVALKLSFSTEAAAALPKPRVIRISPSLDAVPANLLRVYVYFSNPMSRRGIAQHIRLTEASGKPVDDAFLEMNDGLWDPEGRRLTVLFHPGRIKRGLALHDRLGLALEPGKRYRLIVEKAVEDENGQPLLEEFVKEFGVLPEDRASPNVRNWKVDPPAPGGRASLLITADEPLDEALFARCLRIEGDRTVPGEATVDPDGRHWRFVPEQAWAAGSYVVHIAPELEDLAGNRLTRLFDEPARKDGTRAQAREVTLRFVIP